MGTLFTTDDSLCPIESYEAINLVSGIISAHSGCSSPDLSNPCRRVRTDTSQIGVYVVKFKVKAKGSSEIESSSITITIYCPSTVGITEPLPV